VTPPNAKDEDNIKNSGRYKLLQKNQANMEWQGFTPSKIEQLIDTGRVHRIEARLFLHSSTRMTGECMRDLASTHSLTTGPTPRKSIVVHPAQQNRDRKRTIGCPSLHQAPRCFLSISNQGSTRSRNAPRPSEEPTMRSQSLQPKQASPASRSPNSSSTEPRDNLNHLWTNPISL